MILSKILKVKSTLKCMEELLRIAADCSFSNLLLKKASSIRPNVAKAVNLVTTLL